MYELLEIREPGLSQECITTIPSGTGNSHMHFHDSQLRCCIENTILIVLIGRHQTYELLYQDNQQLSPEDIQLWKLFDTLSEVNSANLRKDCELYAINHK